MRLLTISCLPAFLIGAIDMPAVRHRIDAAAANAALFGMSTPLIF